MQKLQFIIGGSQAFIRLGKNPALILGEFNKDALGLVALQEALDDWNEKQAYIAQYAAQAQEAAPPQYKPGDRVVALEGARYALTGELGTVEAAYSAGSVGLYYVRWDPDDFAIPTSSDLFRHEEKAQEDAPEMENPDAS